MNVYIIEYDFMGDTRKVEADNLLELMQELERLDNEEHILNSTIVINTVKRWQG